MRAHVESTERKSAMHTVSHDGTTIAYRDIGSGTPVLLVHGHPFDGSMWRPQIEQLAEAGHRVIVPDLRGYGRSSVAPGSTTMEDFAADLAELLDRLDIDRVLLGGLSMGGQIVMEFHRRFPSRVAGLLLAATSARADDPRARRARVETAERIRHEGMAAYAEELLPRMLAPHNIVGLPEVADHVLRMMRSAPAEGAAAALRGRAERRDYRDSLARVSVPTLIVVGDHDDFTPVAEAESLAAHIPASVLRIIEGAGHLPNLERPAEFGRALAELSTAIDVG
ncbi:putative hydrolase or acyltransferase of alpha/beta superfamily [Actinoalloteichus hymeniacidonis]|uniref:Hydrolase or acyltransferase of alpha/beta superfamily n=2 Tax=Actinoalloteichus hymeniacidonis TaxID=340345 RepID=A0AAC9MYD4_9PSEU|nr:putative hydrolase or acyltransferase of alpha/beta superfamily [Actinoalloteichus hymeniacidonis]